MLCDNKSNFYCVRGVVLLYTNAAVNIPKHGALITSQIFYMANYHCSGQLLVFYYCCCRNFLTILLHIFNVGSDSVVPSGVILIARTYRYVDFKCRSSFVSFNTQFTYYGAWNFFLDNCKYCRMFGLYQNLNSALEIH
jgi:hypothetical protein